MPHGKLEVYVEGAVDIKDSSILGKGSPYCTLTTGSQERSTPPIAEGGTRPCFNTKFEFQVDRTTEQLTVEIFSKKKLRDDDLLGHCRIIFKDVFYHGHVVPVKSYALTRTNGQPGGHIRLSLTFKAKLRPVHQQPYPPTSPHRPISPPLGPIHGYRTPCDPLPSNRFMTEEDSDSSDDDDALAPHEGQHRLPRLRPEPPPGQPVRTGAGPPPNTNTNSLSRSFDGSDWGDGSGRSNRSGGDGSDWSNRGGDFEGSSVSYGSAPEEQSYYGENNSAIVTEVEDCETRGGSYGGSQDDAVGAPGYGPHVGALHGRRGPPPVRGRPGPRGRAGPRPVGRGGMPIRGGRGRGPPPSLARGGPPPVARGAPPPMARGAPPPMARGGPLPMARGGPPPLV